MFSLLSVWLPTGVSVSLSFQLLASLVFFAAAAKAESRFLQRFLVQIERHRESEAARTSKPGGEGSSFY